MNLSDRLHAALLAQKCFVLALQNQGLNFAQRATLDEILKMNDEIAALLGIDLPDLPTLERMSMEHQALEVLYGVTGSSKEEK